MLKTLQEFFKKLSSQFWQLVAAAFLVIIFNMAASFGLSLVKAMNQSCKETWGVENLFVTAHWFCPK